MKKMDPSVRYSDDIIGLLRCIIEATGMTSTILSFQRKLLESNK
ncbi:hypothetical protein [Wolbachia endosymbiont of Ctenocephalides felis wCfeJ]|nr:hypothetical protein [Wolbachia endosymbiont of Ctenocephalides felis wCfeJ]